MKPIALLGDSWAAGPAPGQPNVGNSLSALGFPVHNFATQIATFTSADVMNVIHNFVISGGDGSQFSMVLISTGGHDMINGASTSTTINNLVQIGNDCSKIGLRCEVIAFPQIVMNGNYVTFPTLGSDAAFYDQAASYCQNLQILHGAVCKILSNLAAYKNAAYSQYIPHYNQAGADAFASDLVQSYIAANGAPS